MLIRFIIMFYETIDEVFDILFDRYGLEIEIIEMKEKILNAYENEDKIKAKRLYNIIKSNEFIVTKEGDIEYLKTC